LNRRLLTLIGLAAAAAVVYARFIEPHRLVVESVPLTLPRLPYAFNHYRIAHISDLHLGGWMTSKRLLKAVEMVNAERPDLVVITGDFVEKFANEAADELSVPLKRLRALDGVVAVLGNHDYRYGVPGLRRILADCGVIELSNAVHSLRRGDAQLHIAGLDDQAWHEACLDAVLDQLPRTGAAILLAHEPDFADVTAATGRFDLQLSGHTHGGQIRLPLIGIPVLPSHGIRYAAGQYQVGRMIQYTNRGLGMITPYVRFNCRPEITLFTLMAGHA
jgi:hypothetical protein